MLRAHVLGEHLTDTPPEIALCSAHVLACWTHSHHEGGATGELVCEPVSYDCRMLIQSWFCEGDGTRDADAVDDCLERFARK